jgi:carboxyl-terminal processing protease
MLPSDPPTAGDPTPVGQPTPTEATDPIAAAYEVPATSVAPPPGPAIDRSSVGSRRRTPILGLSIALVAVLAGSALFLAGWTVGSRQAATPGTPAGDEAVFAPFWSAYHFVIDNFAGGPIDKKALVDGAIKGMIGALGDPYSSYLTSDEFKQSLQGINGQFEGIGAEIATKKADGTDSDCTTLGADCRLTIVAPIQGSPAEKAGLKPADVVTAVDGQPVDGQTVDQVRDRIRGPKGTTVSLSVLRGSTPMTIEVTRDVIQQQEVITKDLAGGRIGYIRITGFSEDAAKAVTATVKKDVGAGEKDLILDLRGNPGGFVDAARTIASQFIASGPIYWQQDARGNKLEVDAEPNGAATDPSIKMVVLIDKGSASASEIVAAALQEHDRATLVGDTSYGKGTVQQWHDLSDDNGGFRLTIARWLTPQQHWIHGVGITPDVRVTVPANNPAGQDPQLDKAVELLTTETSALDRAA